MAQAYRRSIEGVQTGRIYPVATSLCRPAGAGAYIRPSLQVH
ncbi:short chain dehydrogenase [Klebsiella pneumoniae IS53]|nr:short chain dehydrogenase [Klebsiella pneumoniae IS53]